MPSALTSTQQSCGFGPADVRAVIFDCDGTLVDSEDIAFRVIHRQALDLGVRQLSEAALHELRGRSMSTSLGIIERHLGRPLPVDFEATLRSAMAEAFRAELVPMAGAALTLERLNVPFCVASNGPRSKTELTLGIAGLLPHLRNSIFSAYEVGLFKPDPGLFLAAARSMGVPPENCAVVEDSLPGMVAGLAAGMTVYAVRGSVVIPDELAARVRGLANLHELALQDWNRPGRPPSHA